MSHPPILDTRHRITCHRITCHRILSLDSITRLVNACDAQRKARLVQQRRAARQRQLLRRKRQEAEGGAEDPWEHVWARRPREGGLEGLFELEPPEMERAVAARRALSLTEGRSELEAAAASAAAADAAAAPLVIWPESGGGGGLKIHAEALTVLPRLARHLKLHQEEGIRFIWKACFGTERAEVTRRQEHGCVLAHSMGLGKTLTLLRQSLTLPFLPTCHTPTFAYISPTTVWTQLPPHGARTRAPSGGRLPLRAAALRVAPSLVQGRRGRRHLKGAEAEAPHRTRARPKVGRRPVAPRVRAVAHQPARQAASARRFFAHPNPFLPYVAPHFSHISHSDLDF